MAALTDTNYILLNTITIINVKKNITNYFVYETKRIIVLSTGRAIDRL